MANDPTGESANGSTIQRQAAELLELFYPVHYGGNMALEDAMRGALTRKQAAILWLIRSEGESARGMRRKDIFRKLQDWFDITSPAVTKALRAMMHPPLGLVRLAESADSAREKTVFLTAKGEQYLGTMVARGLHYMQRILEETAKELSTGEIDAGVKFLRGGIVGYERIRAIDAARETDNTHTSASRAVRRNGRSRADAAP